MESIVKFLESIVGDSARKRLGMLMLILIALIAGAWIYENYTGKFKSDRMKFELEHLEKLSSPELRKNCEADSELANAHAKMKTELSQYVDQTHNSLEIPAPILRTCMYAVPWIILGIGMHSLAEGETGIKGYWAAFIILVLLACGLGAMIPATGIKWLDYLILPLVPLGAILLLGIAIRKTKTPSNR